MAIAPAMEIATGSVLPIDELRTMVERQAETMNQVWLVVSMALIFLMQAGFLLLEAGASRSKNSINVAQKNLVDFTLAGLIFYLIGFSVMFGPSLGGVVGIWSGLPHPTHTDQLHVFMFQLMFCGTAATIVSGAVAERMTFKGYLGLTILISALIYPVFGHWAWGTVFIPDNPAILAQSGFYDFAGGTVVHAVGGWVALAAIIVLGPRQGKFDADGNPRQIIGHSAVMSTLGCILLWIGWIGFNGGSLAPSSDLLGSVVANTMLAGIAGGTVACFAGYYRDGYFRPDRLVNGVLAGLVGVTAGATLFDTWIALLVGAFSGVAAMVAIWFIESKLRLDDVVGAVAVHGVCGSLGTIFVGLLGDIESLEAGSRFAQVLIQIQGVLLCAIWSFGVTYLVLRLVKKRINLRVTPEEEETGLNAAEHGWSLGSGQLIEALSAWGDGGDAKLVDEQSGDEAAEIAQQINRIMSVRDQREQGLLHDAMHDSLTGILNRQGFNGIASRAMLKVENQSARFAIIALDLDGFKPVNDTYGHAVGDEVLVQAAARMAACLRDQDTIARTGGDEFVALVDLADNTPSFADMISERILKSMGQPFNCQSAHVKIGISIGVSVIPDEAKSIGEAIEQADRWLYQSKRHGRNRATSSRTAKTEMSVHKTSSEAGFFAD